MDRCEGPIKVMIQTIVFDNHASQSVNSFEKAANNRIEAEVSETGEEDEDRKRQDVEEEREEVEEDVKGLSQDGLRVNSRRVTKKQRQNEQRGQSGQE